jgi:hypothetical protein
MAGRKNMYQQYGAMMDTIKGKDIMIRNDAFMRHQINVFCRGCGKAIEMPSREEGNTRSMDIYMIEMEHQIHADCAREFDKNGTKY